MPSKRAKWDLFISHASEDKVDFVEPLASALTAFGVKVWFDKFALKLGDSLSRSIDRGLANSSYGLIVVSPAFISKKWPDYELRGLLAKELTSGRTILPIWHKITRAKVLKFSPTLADKFAIISADLTPVQIAIEVIKIVRPDILTQIHRRIIFLEERAKSTKTSVPASELLPAPIQHDKLPKELIGRIRLVRACLLGANTHSMEYWIDGFKRDSHPSQEVSYWEHVCSVFLEYIAMNPSLTKRQREAAYDLVSTLWLGPDTGSLKKATKALPRNALTVIKRIYESETPAYDIREAIPAADIIHTEQVIKMFKGFDKESFPKDIPEELIRSLMETKHPRRKERS